MNASAITYVEIIGIHGQYDLHVKLRPGLNIIYGRNGSGKTTFLHAIANLAEGDIERFCQIQFQRISVGTVQGTRIDLHQVREDKSVSVRADIDQRSVVSVQKGDETPIEARMLFRDLLGGRPVYLPAFRSVLEAIGRSNRYHEERQKEFEALVKLETEGSKNPQSSWHPYLGQERVRNFAFKTMLCREWFGPFVPMVRCPSLWEVSDELVNELQEAQFEVASTDRRAFADVFVHVLEAVLKDTAPKETQEVTTLLSKIEDYLKHSEISLTGEADTYKSVYQSIARLVAGQSKKIGQEKNISHILQVYEQALSARTEAVKQAFSRIKTFETSVNHFLKGKHLSAESLISLGPRRRPQSPPLITLANGQKATLSVLSSGERQVLTLLFSATHMSSADGVVLIDEPELSLHVDWQRIILRELIKQAATRQVVTCTHAPEIGADHRNSMVELTAKLSSGAGPVQRDIFESTESS